MSGNLFIGVTGDLLNIGKIAEQRASEDLEHRPDQNAYALAWSFSRDLKFTNGIGPSRQNELRGRFVERYIQYRNEILGGAEGDAFAWPTE